ncbi:hypothetical protein CEXT_475771 [Caerostris extrusa]|uniref:Uncharacterized protein n=1 Tax=Caerostris extrusa TaxID=172846 RepID=A0AAV4XH06_CAEEX|nr:hypothetical protein CEXT_475771 [Caerostris extrusa]
MLYPVEDDRYDEIRRMSFSLDSKNVDDSKTNSTAKDSPKKKIFYLVRFPRLPSFGTSPDILIGCWKGRRLIKWPGFADHHQLVRRSRSQRSFCSSPEMLLCFSDP